MGLKSLWAAGGMNNFMINCNYLHELIIIKFANKYGYMDGWMVQPADYFTRKSDSGVSGVTYWVGVGG